MSLPPSCCFPCCCWHGTASSRRCCTIALWEPSHAHQERGFQGFCLCDWTHCQPTMGPECVRIQIQFISAYISTWAPQSEPDLSRSPKLKRSRWLCGKMPCCLARMTFSAHAAKITALPVSKSLHQGKETPNPFGHGCKPLQWDILRYKQVTVTCLWVRRSV